MEKTTTCLAFWIFLSLSGRQVYSLMRVTTVLDAPYMMLSSGEGKRGNDRYEGFCADLLEGLSRRAIFNYTIQPSKDGKYGVKNPDGTWNGMIGELIRQEADLAVAPLVITSARERVVDFTKPYLSLGIAVMIKKPETLPAVSELTLAFLSPFPVGIWIGLLVACPTIGLLLYLFARFNPVETQQSTSSSSSSGAEAPSGDVTAVTLNNGFNLSNSFWFSVRTLLQQGTPAEPRSVSCRILSAVWWMFALIVIAAYTANLVAMAINAGSRLLTPIASVEDLAKQSEIRYGTVQSGSTKEFFKNAKEPLYKTMWEAMSADPTVFVASTDKGIEKVRESRGMYAFLTDSTTIDYANQQFPCDTMRIGSNLDYKGFGIATPKGSQLRARLGMAVLELLEEGKIQRLYSKWWRDRRQCSGSADQGHKSRFVNISGAFYALIIGVVVAAVSAVIEFVYWRKKQPTKL